MNEWVSKWIVLDSIGVELMGWDGKWKKMMMKVEDEDEKKNGSLKKQEQNKKKRQ